MEPEGARGEERDPRPSLAVRAFVEGLGLAARWEFHAMVGAFGFLLVATNIFGRVWPAEIHVIRICLVFLVGAFGAGEARPFRVFASGRAILCGIAAGAVFLIAPTRQTAGIREGVAAQLGAVFLRNAVVLAALVACLDGMLRCRGLRPPSILTPILVSLLLSAGVALAAVGFSNLPIPGLSSLIRVPLDSLGFQAFILVICMLNAYWYAFPALLLGRWMLLAAGGKDPREDAEGGDA